MTSDRKPTARFSDRAGYYVRFRPGYPDAVLNCLAQEAGLTPDSVVADIGSGTGILSKKFLAHGNTVYAVEPNDEMRTAAETLLHGYPGFHSVRGTAEATTLPPALADLVTAGQAFHWFDRDRTRTEFARILKPSGWVALLWNTRRTGASAFQEEYERLLQEFAVDYRQVDHRKVTGETLRGFFASVRKHVFPNDQEMDFPGLTGRLLSCSYAPLEGHPNFIPMMNELERIFRSHQIAGKVRFEYDTELYVGKLQRD